MWLYKINNVMLKHVQQDTRKIVLLTFCLLLTACGFHPLYVSREESSDIAYPLKIATIPDRNGQILRNYLIDLLTPAGQPLKPKYILETKLVESVKGIGINKNETTSRMEAIMTATITLKDSKTNKIMYNHTTTAINSFAVISQNYYSDLIAEEYAKKEAIRLLAEKIKLLISVYLNKHYED